MTEQWITVEEAQAILARLPPDEPSPYVMSYGVDPDGGPLMVMLTAAEPGETP